MRKLAAKTACLSAFLVCLLVWNVTGRNMQYDASHEQVSDGVRNGVDRTGASSLFLHLKGWYGSESEEQCEQMYGFLPCSSNLPGHLFLIVVYEYLLYHGESYAGGDGRIFGVLGNNFFGASVFQLLDSLPDSLILLGTSGAPPAFNSQLLQLLQNVMQQQQSPAASYGGHQRLSPSPAPTHMGYSNTSALYATPPPAPATSAAMPQFTDLASLFSSMSIQQPA